VFVYKGSIKELSISARIKEGVRISSIYSTYNYYVLSNSRLRILLFVYRLLILLTYAFLTSLYLTIVI
jgi:hypothetical protein